MDDCKGLPTFPGGETEKSVETAVRILLYFRAHAAYYREVNIKGGLRNVTQASSRFLARYSERNQELINSIADSLEDKACSSLMLSRDYWDTASKRIREIAGRPLDYKVIELWL